MNDATDDNATNDINKARRRFTPALWGAFVECREEMPAPAAVAGLCYSVVELIFVMSADADPANAVKLMAEWMKDTVDHNRPGLEQRVEDARAAGIIR